MLCTSFKIFVCLFFFFSINGEKNSIRVLFVSFSCSFNPHPPFPSETPENESRPCVGVLTNRFIFILLSFLVSLLLSPELPRSRRAAALQSVRRTDEARLQLSALAAERVRRGRSLNTTPVL